MRRQLLVISALVIFIVLFSLSVSANVNLTITKTDSADPIIQGSQVNYSINVSNINNSIQAGNVTVVEFYSPNVTFIAASLAPNISNDTWILNISPESSVIINITVNVSEFFVGEIENIVNISNYTNASSDGIFILNGTDAGVELTNDTENTTIVGGQINLTITKTDDIDPIVQGNTLTYTINVSNIGNVSARNVTVLETYPSSGVRFESASPTANVSNDTWILGPIPNGTSQTIEITLTVVEAVALSNQVNITNYTNSTLAVFTLNSTATVFTATQTTAVTAQSPLFSKSGTSTGHNPDERDCVLGGVGERACPVEEEAPEEECRPIYKCGTWSSCDDGTQHRTCKDNNKCGKTLEVERDCSEGTTAQKEARAIEKAMAAASPPSKFPWGFAFIVLLVAGLAGYEYTKSRKK